MFRIATINIGKNVENHQQRLAALTERLRKEQLDILCCQETFRSMDGEFDTAAAIAGGIGMNYTFSAAGQKKRVILGKRVDSVSGLTILTGYSTWMLCSGSFTLPGNSRDNRRIAQYAVIRKNGDAVLIFNLHLSRLQNETTLRGRQLQAVFNHPIMEKKPYAAILLCGDLNAQSGAEEMEMFQSQTKYIVRDGFIAGGGAPNVSTIKPGGEGVTTERGRAIGHIYILEKRTRPVAKIKFSNSRLIFDQDDAEGIVPPDHLGIVLDLKLSRKNINEQSQIRRYGSFTQPWLGTSEKEQCYSL